MNESKQDLGDILIVEENEQNSNLLSDILTEQGYLIRGARTGRTALDILESDPPELVLLALILPDMEGYEICRRIKAEKRHQDLPVLFLTDAGETDQELPGLKFSGVDVISIPFRTETVLARVQNHLTLSRLKQNLEQLADRRTVELKAGLERFRLFADYNPNKMYIKDQHKRHIFFNQSLQKFAQKKPEEFIGTTSHNFFSKEIADYIEHYDQLVLDGEPVVNVPEYEASIGQKIRRFEEIKFRIPGPGGQTCIGGIVTETTQQRAYERRLEKMQYSIDNALDRMAWIDGEGRFLYANKAACAEMGFSRDQIRDMTISDVDPAFPPEAWKAHFQDLKTKGSLRLETTQLDNDGNLHNIDVSSRYLSFGKDEFICAFGRDFTRRKQAEEKLEDAFQEIKALKDRLEQENIYLREISKTSLENKLIVGTSTPVKNMLALARQVAETDSTVLIMGETGTGKELLAQSIHEMSRRKRRTMIRVNCAALPATLIESEFFGREKGAYTGAMTKRVGRFELADGSTILLDEIGELPLEIQAKLLRVLQEGRFERLGDNRTIQTDVRVISSTNRDLMGMVKKGRFRRDLFYRLNVFPIIVPPLRERIDDIPQLTWTFVNRIAKKMGKSVERIPLKSMRLMQDYPWPGNIRELKNVIERAMIHTNGPTLAAVQLETGETAQTADLRFEAIQKEHILKVLEMTRWRIKGNNGAAAVLDLNPSTLRSKMKKLGIERESQDH